MQEGIMRTRGDHRLVRARGDHAYKRRSEAGACKMLVKLSGRVQFARNNVRFMYCIEALLPNASNAR